MKFVDSMVGISWTKNGKFDSDSDELALKRAIAGYHAFLDIMAQNPDSFLVPTLVSRQTGLGWRFTDKPFRVSIWLGTPTNCFVSITGTCNAIVLRPQLMEAPPLERAPLTC